MKKNILRGEYSLETEIERADYRRYLTGVYVYLFGFIAHICLLALFINIKVQPMIYFNMGSILLYASCFFLNRRRHYIIAFLLGYGEVLAHACFATFFTGWDAGFHSFIFVAGTGIYFITIKSGTIKTILLMTAIACYVGLAVYMHNRTPVDVLHMDTLFLINTSIIAGTLIALAFLGNYHNLGSRHSAKLLEEERRKLETQNTMIKNELRMAKKIQMQNIPLESPLPWIDFHYKPMYQLGGDFFDFTLFPSGNVGIFLSDVSGHGVPAAFVTSMIKSYCLQHALQLRSPSALIRGLNNFLYARTGGNFITVFYGILNKSRDSLTFCNAGHPPPFLMEQNGIRRVPSSAGSPPLTVLSNDELEQTGKQYSDETLSLPRRSRLLLYTDGMTEATCLTSNDNNVNTIQRDFESEALMPLLDKIRAKNCNEIISCLVGNLKDFRGADSYEDDVCLICLEI